MNLIELSLRRRVFAWMIMFSLVVFGAISLNRLGISQMPDVDFPVLDVSVSYEGASPSVIEADIIDPIEERLLSIEGVKELRSSARLGAGSVRIELELSRNVDVALQEVQSALSQLRLPRDADNPVIRKTNPEEEPIMFLGVYGDATLKELIKYTDSILLDQLRFLPNVGEVSIGGFSDRNIRIWPDFEKLKQYDITVSEIADAILTQHLESAAGQITEGERELRLRFLGEASTIEQIQNLRILRRGGEVIRDATVRVKDLARVEDDLSDIRRVARVDGKPAVAVSVRKQRGSNEVEVANSVLRKIEEIQGSLPKGIQVRVNVDFTSPTRAVVNTTTEKLLLSAVVTILVCLLFLGSWQAALNVLFSIPTSLFGTLIVLAFSGFTLNTFTLLALILAISIVIDDAIMLLENIVRHYRMGKSPFDAAYDGSMEVLPAATAATLAIVAVFLPVIFMDGITGKFFYQFGITLSAAVLLSLLEAVTITPMRAATFLATGAKTTRFEHSLESIFHRLGLRYQRLVKWSVQHAKTVIALSTLIFVGSLVVVQNLKQEFVPAQDQNFIIISGQTPPGTSLERTSEAVKQIEEFLLTQEEVEGFFVSAGAGGPASSVNQFFVPVRLKPREEREVGHLQLISRWGEEIKRMKGLRAQLRDISARNLTTGSIFPVAFNIVGPELETLSSLAERMIKELPEQKVVQSLDTNFKMGFPEVALIPNRERMAELGVSIEAVARTLSIATAGVRLNRFTADGKRHDVRVKLPEDALNSPQKIRDVYVRNQYGNLVSLMQLVKLEEIKTYQSISRINRQRAVNLNGTLGAGVDQGQALRAISEFAKVNFPPGYRVEFEGSASSLGESFASLTNALLIGILVAYIILAVQFNSFIHPITVLVALPFSVTGALLTLWIFGLSLNLFSFIGLIVLMGIAKKNSILLVEYTNQMRARGMSAEEALIEACPVRLRPILMTSAATVIAALPLVIGDSVGQETRTPMGMVIIGGTILSTLLTLVMVPSLYQLLTRFERRSEG